jgi:hypothetical protein
MTIGNVSLVWNRNVEMRIRLNFFLGGGVYSELNFVRRISQFRTSESFEAGF